MRTFIGEYFDKHFILSNEAVVLKAELLSILNTPIGSRFYYPEYGCRLNEYRFKVLDNFAIEMIGSEIKRAASMLDGATLTAIEYYVSNNTVYYIVTLERFSSTIKVNLSVVDGVAY